MKEIKKQWDEVNRIKVFEIPVIDKKSGEKDIIMFNIDLVGDKFKASHIALNKKEEQSDLIAFKEITIDEDLSLDENLTALYEECSNAIFYSEFYIPSDWDTHDEEYDIPDPRRKVLERSRNLE